MVNINEIRIKQILAEKGWSMKDLILKIGFSEQGYAYMMKNGTMKVTTLLKIADELGVPVTYLLITGNKDERPYDSSMSDGTHRGNIRYVPASISAGFLAHFGDDEFISGLPTFVIPGFEGNNFILIPVDGDSMYPTISSGDLILIIQVEEFDSVRPNEVYAVVTREGMVVKRILPEENQDKLVFVSDNAFYPSYSVNKSEIRAIYLVKAFISKNMAPRNLIENEIIKYKNEIIKMIASKNNQ